jgi:hypothetical protein
MFLTKWHFEINVSGQFSEMPLMFVLKLLFLRKWAFLLDVIAISPIIYTITSLRFHLLLINGGDLFTNPSRLAACTPSKPDLVRVNLRLTIKTYLFRGNSYRIDETCGFFVTSTTVGITWLLPYHRWALIL